MGYFRSYALDRPELPDGSPLPWICYPAIHLLDERLQTRLRLFEFGCGYSTFYYQGRVAEVVSLEHDRGWAERVRTLAADNVSVMHRPAADGSAYCGAITDQPGAFDVIVIDGIHRASCAAASVGALSETGVILFDDSQRAEYAIALEAIQKCGFRRLDLVGAKPASMRVGSTSIFYRDGNCLGL